MVNILGINLSDLKRFEIAKKIEEFLEQKERHYLVTPNPEIILASHQDEELFYILNKADLAIADGFGLKLAGHFYGENIPRLTGADLTLDLLELAKNRGLKIAILNWRAGLSNKKILTAALTKKYPGLLTLILDLDRTPTLPPAAITDLNNFAPQILFVTFGSPYQEKIIYHNLAKLTTIKLALGVGGAFDFISGQANRAPKFLRQAGLEWLWRLAEQPRRLKRIYNATIVFLYKIIRARFINQFLYRSNVVCFLYKKKNNIYQVAIVQREDNHNHWQLPQGGRDGQTVATAGAREMAEELGTNKFITKAIFENVSRYNFWGEGSRRRYQRNYKGQKQSLYIAEFTGQDRDIKINFWDHTAWRWVETDKLIESVHPHRQESTRIFLDKFKSLNA
ncbi:MAG: WecB/TagA/CpsF family glycosyltransferase [Patescibacteria group bacterium]